MIGESSLGLWRRLAHAHYLQSHSELLGVVGWELAILQESRLPLLQLRLARMEVPVGQVALPSKLAAVLAELVGPSVAMEKKCEPVNREEWAKMQAK